MGFWSNKVIFLFLLESISASSTGIQNNDNWCEMGDETFGQCKEIMDCFSKEGQIASAETLKLCNTSTHVSIIVCCRTTPEEYVKDMCAKWRNESKKVSDLLPCTADSRVRGGTEADHGQFPHMVSILKPDKKQDGNLTHICGGSLISENFVLTAAHCLKDASSELFVLIGSHELIITEEEGRTAYHKVATNFVHPNYIKDQLYNDIALLQLEFTGPKIEITKSIRPACLPQQKYRIEAGTTLVVAGWGGYGDGEDKRKSNVPHSARVKAMDRLECNNKLYALHNSTLPAGITDSIICANETITGTCKGDSGGPVMLPATNNGVCDHDHELVGLVFGGLDGCTNNPIPGLYTRVDYYLDWIVKVVWASRKPINC